LTQQGLCERANLSYSTLAKIERGAIKAPSIFTIQSIAEALNTSLDNLLGIETGQTAKPKRKSKSGVSFVYFDINGCLVRFYQRAFSQLAQEIGVPSDLVEGAYWHFNDEVCRGTMSMSDFNAALAERLGATSVDWSKYYLSAVEPIKEMQELLAWSAEHYRVGLLSNIMPGLLPEMRKRGLLPQLNYDAVVDSSEVGAIKPDPRIYEIAAEKAGCPPEEILLIDDTRANLMTAEKAGWHVMWFDGYHAADASANFQEALQPAE
jgi:putative hydrolase of the HAD superfamily